MCLNTDIYAITYTKTTNMTPLDHLKEILLEEIKRKFPSVPDHARQINTFDTMKPEKREKKRIEAFLNASGHRAFIVENRGFRKDNTEIVTDILGRRKKIGSVDFIPSGIRKGVEDVSSTIKGRTVAIELKRIYKKGRDSQSDDQKKEQIRVEKSGGIYLIVDSFEDFYQKYWDLLKIL